MSDKVVNILIGRTVYEAKQSDVDELKTAIDEEHHPDEIRWILDRIKSEREESCTIDYKVSLKHGDCGPYIVT